MDQFATGLTGTRTPYGACASVADPRYVSGGSSSGSAVVVADGTVPFALGTDTAGSGRVPAAFNAIVGLKPSPGRIGTSGVVPACRSLDCVSLLTTGVADAARVLAVAGGRDAADPYSRAMPGTGVGRAAGGRGGARADRRPARRRPDVLRRRPGGGSVAGRPAAGGGARLAGDRDRLRAVRRDRGAPVRRAVGRRALRGGGVVHRRAPRGRRSLGARDHHGRPRCRRGRGLPRRAPRARARAAERGRLAAGRCAAAADGSDALHRRGDRRGSARAQRAARHVHELREPARPLRDRRPGRRARRRPAVRRLADRPRPAPTQRS